MAERKDKGQNAAERGANKLIDLLAHSGTGNDKLDIAREVLNDLGDVDGEEAGAQAVVTHLKRRNVGEGTVAKAEKFVKDGLEDKEGVTRRVEAAFNPALTAPGTVPTSAQTQAAQRVATRAGDAEPTRHEPKEGGGAGQKK